MPRRSRLLLGVLAALVGLTVLAPAAHAQTPAYDAVVDLTFPVDGPVTFTDDYHAPRGGGTRVHKATDLGGAKAYGLPVHAAVGGTVTFLTGLNGAAPHATAGYMITIAGDDGRRYNYIHLGRQDGPPAEAYAPGLAVRQRVERGQHIGYLGHSGNASPSWPHLHFEIEDGRVVDPYGTHRMNPYRSLLDAQRRGDLPATRRRFLDVAPTDTHYQAILWLADTGITKGCRTQRFCPNASVTRAQTASFLARALELPPTNATPFLDVPADHEHATAIAQVHAAGIARGSTDGRFRPEQSVNRAQMASFIAAARGLTPTSTTLPFSDLDPADVHTPAIVALHEAGIVFGNTSGTYQPTQAVTRAQMASFLERAFAASS
ncbi:S-layer homology domain-containing protein [Egicoccus sp. AB-alg2]|uniref:S-layer homology domain-containing protein n=1 Tax=Egicoccus sp. AB-alg2 TaxID=3242693 RepID=UPI00359F0340